MEVIDERKRGIFAGIAESKVLAKLKKIKNIELIAAVFIIAVALLIYSGVTAKGKSAGEDVQASAGVMDGEEKRLASILSGIDGAGRVETMITREDGEIVGILVIAEGAEDITVMLKLLTATTTAMGVDKSIVDVYGMK